MWVTGRYRGKRGKSVADHAHAGIGYTILDEEGRGDGYTVTVAFRYFGDEWPLPYHLEEIKDYRLIEKLEEKLATR